MNPSSLLLVLGLASLPVLATSTTSRAAEPARAANAKSAANATSADIFRKDNLAAWCIVPYDKAKRNPEQRAAMLESLGIKKFVYDYRAEHIPQFEDEVIALKKHGVELTGWMFSPATDPQAPTQLAPKGRETLDMFARHGVKPQLWIINGGQSIDPGSPEEQERRVAAEVNALRPVSAAAKERGLQVGLYNHGGWYGEPENQIAIIDRLRKEGFDNVGIVYNQHHGHGHIARFSELMQRMAPYLICFNLNGMEIKGDTVGRKILPLGAGPEDVQLLKTLRDSGYKGLIGILNHTGEDAELRLQDNLDGLAWLTPQLDGKPAGAPPEYRSWKPAPKPAQ
jgi:hypothetical protein